MPSFSAQDLLEGRAVALAVIHAPRHQHDPAGRVEADFGMLVITPAGGGNGGRYAHSQKLAPLLRRLAAVVDAVVAGQRQAIIEVLDEIAGIVGLLQDCRERDGARRDRIAAAQLHRVDPQLARRLVDDGFGDVDRLGTTAAAIGSGRHRIGQRRDDPGVNRRNAIGVDQTGQPDRQGYGRAVGRIISADPRLPLRPQCEKPAVAVEREFGVDDAAPALLVGRQPLASFGNPPHRPANDLGRPQRQRVFRIAAALHAESAAHVVAHHPELVLRQFEDPVGERGAGGVHRLDRAADRIAVLGAVVFADAAARLHRVRRDPVDADLVANDAVRAGKRRIDRIFAADFVKEGLVARVLVPNCWRARGQRCRGGDHRRQRRVVDLDQFGRVLRLVQGIGDDERHRVADIAHAPLGEQRLRANESRGPIAASSAHAGHQGAETAALQILSGQDSEHAGRRPRPPDIDRENAGMGIWRAQHVAARVAGSTGIVDIAAATLQQAQVLLASDRFANGLHAHVLYLPPAITTSPQRCRARRDCPCYLVLFCYDQVIDPTKMARRIEPPRRRRFSVLSPSAGRRRG